MEFEFVAGDVALDFVATVAERGTTHVERLTTPKDLAEWLALAGVLDGPPKAKVKDLVAARELREAAHALVVALTAGTQLPAGAVRVVNAYAAAPPPLVRLDVGGRPARTGDVSAALSQVARAAIGLCAPDVRGHIRWCAGERCTRAFVDRSRAQARQWCQMSGCGDRAKAAAYRQRHAAHTP